MNRYDIVLRKTPPFIDQIVMSEIRIEEEIEYDECADWWKTLSEDQIDNLAQIWYRGFSGRGSGDYYSSGISGYSGSEGLSGPAQIRPVVLAPIV